MFDVSFGELLLIAIVALVVIGPERLPKVARTLGLLAGRMQRYVNGIKTEITRELQLQELQKMQEDVRSRVMAIETDVKEELRQMEAPVHDAVQAVENAAKSEAPSSKP